MTPSPLLPGEVAELRRVRSPSSRARLAIWRLAVAVLVLLAILALIGALR